MAAADRKGGRKPMEGTLNHFEKLLEGPCPNHAFPVKHLYKYYGLMKHFLSRGSNTGLHGKDPDPTTDDTKGKDGGFWTLDDCIMIFDGMVAYDSKRRQKVTCCEVYMAESATLSFLHEVSTRGRPHHQHKAPHQRADGWR